MPAVGQAHGLFHLPEDLRFAQHRKVESARDAERSMARRIAVVHDMGMLLKMLGADSALFGQPVQRRLQDRRRRHRSGQVQLGAVAGGDDRRFGINALQAQVQAAQRRRQLLRRERQTPRRSSGAVW